MTNKVYGPQNLVDAHILEPPLQFVAHRRIAAAMQHISAGIIRADATTEELSDWADVLEQLAADMGGRSQRDARAANRRLMAGEASYEDIFDMMDFDPVSGASNPIAPQMDWIRDSEAGVEGVITLGLHYQGPPERVHGGVIAWIMDALLSRAMHAAGLLGLTGTLSTRYLAGTPVGKPLHCKAHIERIEGRKLFIQGSIFSDEQQTSQSEGIFLLPRPRQ